MKFLNRLKTKLLEIVYPVTRKEKLQFFESFSLMLVSGIDIIDALDGLEEEARSRGLKRMVGNIRAEIDQGNPIWLSLYHNKVLKNYLVAILRLGEEAGKLNENFEIVNEYIRKEQKLRSGIKSASLYPSFILILLLLIASGVALFILPNLAKTYENLNVDLPWLTKALIDTGYFMEVNGLVVIPVLFLMLGVLIYFVFFDSKTKIIGEWILFHTPGIKMVMTQIELSRLGYLLGVLIKAGIPLVDALKLLSVASPFLTYSRIYRLLAFNIEQGFNFDQSFSRIKGVKQRIPLYARQIILSSEKTGKLDKAFRQIGEVYSQRNESSTKDLTVMIEPVLLLIIWVGVAIIAFAVILPIYSLTNSFGVDEVSTVDVPEGEDPLQYIQVGEVDQGYLNVYESIGGEVITQASSGDEYEYLEEKNGWYRVKIDNQRTGWVNGSYVLLAE